MATERISSPPYSQTRSENGVDESIPRRLFWLAVQVVSHRPARSPDDAAAELRREVAAGRLDGDAVNAVLKAAGHRVNARREWPAGLTAREVEVLKLVARGLSNEEIAEQLTITRKTAGNHVDRVYAKIGVSNRARASLFAIQHGLMLDEYAT